MRRGQLFVLVLSVVALPLGFAAGGKGAVDESTVTPQATPSTTIRVRVIGAGTVTSNPGGINCSEQNQPCEGTFATGTIVTLTATGRAGAPGFVFHVWNPGGPCASVETGTCTFQLTQSFYEAIPAFVGYNLFPPTVAGRWRNNSFTGGLVVRGFVSNPAEMRLNIMSGSRTVAAPVIRRDAAGDFTTTVRLPRRFLPGAYRIVVNAQVTGRIMPDQLFLLNAKGPPEGVLERAFVTSIASVTPKRRLPAGTPGATAHFIFASLPARGRSITTTWFLGSRSLGTARKPRTKNIVSSVLLPGGLPNGQYRCVIRVGAKALQSVSVRIG